MADRAVIGVRVALDVGFQTAWPRLKSLATGGMLARACEVAFGEGTVDLAEVVDPAAGLTRLADVYLDDLTETDDCPLIALQWNAIAADGSLFTALLADLRLIPAGGEVAQLSMTGTYWVPPGRVGARPDRAMVRGQAIAVIGGFLDLVACQLAHPAGTYHEVIT
jgi:hypothetical protein